MHDTFLVSTNFYALSANEVIVLYSY